VRGRVLLLGALSAAGGCAKYAKVKNPDPVRDLKGPVSLVRVSRIFGAANAEERIAFDLRVLAPSDSFVRLDPMSVQLLSPRGEAELPLAGRLESVDPAGAREGASLVIAPGGKARAIVNVRVQEERMVPGREHEVRIAWCTSAMRDGACAPPASRVYLLRVVRVNYVAVAGLGLVLAGALFAVGGG
jgi:hypothetical protein